MAYDFDYRIRTAATASGGSSALTWFQSFNAGLFQTAARRESLHVVPFRDGTFQNNVNEFYDSPVLITDGFLKRTTSTSTGTGGALHIHSNYEGWWQAINDPVKVLWFGINHPVHGRLERRVRPMGRPIVTDTPWRITTNFQAVDAFWRAEDNTTDNGSTFTLAGSAPDGQATLLWTGTTGTVTHVASSDQLTLTAAASTAGILFDMDAKTVTKSSDGSAFTSYTVNSGSWMRFQPGANQITRTAGVTVSIDYFAKHF